MRGIVWSTSANGPCFNSPARMPSECMYVNSFTFYQSQRSLYVLHSRSSSFYSPLIPAALHRNIITSPHQLTHLADQCNNEGVKTSSTVKCMMITEYCFDATPYKFLAQAKWLRKKAELTIYTFIRHKSQTNEHDKKRKQEQRTSKRTDRKINNELYYTRDKHTPVNASWTCLQITFLLSQYRHVL